MERLLVAKIQIPPSDTDGHSANKLLAVGPGEMQLKKTYIHAEVF